MTTTLAIPMRNERHPGARWLLAGLLGLAALLAAAPPSSGQPAEDDDRTLSPFFFVQGADGTTDRLPLKSTTADVRIVGVIADVTVTQVYANEGRRAIEAIYVFPASTRAAVYAMRMTVGARVIEAQIRERAAARADYEQARRQGRTASLLEQQRPNVFQMNVANILPGDEVRVEMRYTELLVPEAGVYEFVYPTVVGPRYSNQSSATAPDRWVENAYLHEGEPPTSAFDVTARVSAGMPIHKVECPSHKVSVLYDGRSVARVSLDRGERAGGNRDFVLRYRLAGGAVESGLLLYRGAQESFFLLMVQPPERVAPEAMPPREYVFVVDVSGSMHGFPLETSKALLRNLLGGLRDGDSFNVLLFAGGSRVLAERSLPATDANLRLAVDAIDRERGGGGTELVPALRRALALPRDGGVSRTIVVVTDGYVNIEKDAFELIRSSLDDANLFAFGIGSSVNRFLIEGMARAGMGEPFIVGTPEGAGLQAERFRATVEAPALTDIEVAFSGFEAYDVEPPAVPDVFAERPVLVFGKWRGEPRGTVTVTGSSGLGAYRRRIDVAAVPLPRGNEALRTLWARHRIASLGDYNRLEASDERVREITSLGLTYSLLTDYTSFVAVDTVARNAGGESTTVQQPLPLPQGVSDYAVGNAKGVGGIVAMSAPLPAAARAVPGKEESRRQVPAQAAGDAGGVTGGVEGGVPMLDERVRREVTQPSTVPAAKDKEVTCLEAAIRRWSFPASTGRTVLVVDLELAGGHWKLAKLTRSTGPLPAADLDKLLRTFATGLSCQPLGSRTAVTVEITVGADGQVLSVAIR
jgi:Ca-activated chloride channel family protein